MLVEAVTEWAAERSGVGFGAELLELTRAGANRGVRLQAAIARAEPTSQARAAGARCVRFGARSHVAAVTTIG